MKRSLGAVAVALTVGAITAACGQTTLPTTGLTTLIPAAPQQGTSSVATSTAVTTPPKPSTTAPRPAAPTADGSREHPYKPGTTFTVGDWRVSLGATNTNATRIVLGENPFNSKPAAGRAFIMALASITYHGDEKETPWMALHFNFVGSDGREYGSGGMEDECGVIPKDLTNVGGMYKGAKASANVCVSVPSTAITGGAWAVGERLSFEDGEVFVSVK